MRSICLCLIAILMTTHHCTPRKHDHKLVVEDGDLIKQDNKPEQEKIFNMTRFLSTILEKAKGLEKHKKAKKIRTTTHRAKPEENYGFKTIEKLNAKNIKEMDSPVMRQADNDDLLYDIDEDDFLRIPL